MCMCDRCEGAMDRRIEITEETYGHMIHETTHVALQAAAACGNRWFDAARGHVSDMTATWGSRGLVRMAYVWGAAWYFLPAPPDRPLTPGHDEFVKLTRRATGHEPSPGRMVKLVAHADQLGAACTTLARHVSTGDVEQLVRVMDEFGGKDESAMSAMIFLLMAEAGVRLRYSRDVQDTLAYELFMAHIHADMPVEDDDDEGEGEQDGRS